MFMVFNTFADADACNGEIFELIKGEEASKGNSFKNGAIEYKSGKKGMERWDVPIKAKDKSKWYIRSPQGRYPDIYNSIETSHTFELLSEIPQNWHKPNV